MKTWHVRARISYNRIKMNHQTFGEKSPWKPNARATNHVGCPINLDSGANIDQARSSGLGFWKTHILIDH